MGERKDETGEGPFSLRLHPLHWFFPQSDSPQQDQGTDSGHGNLPPVPGGRKVVRDPELERLCKGRGK